MSEIFDGYAAYYDLLYQNKDYIAETHFVHKLLAKHGVPSKGELLELGCGTGKHAKGFAQLGYRLHGVDLSPAMVDTANARKPDDLVEKLSFAVGDVRDVRLGRKFDAVISLFHVVSYQITNIDLNAMFQTAADHLKPGGLFLFDCWYGPAVLSDKPEVRIKRMSDAKIVVLRIAEPVIHSNKNVVDVNYTVQVTNAQGEMSTLIEKHQMRYLFSPEIDFLLENNGLKRVELVEWLTGNETGFKTWSATFVAENIL